MDIFLLEFRFKIKTIHYPNSFEMYSDILMSEQIKTNSAAKVKEEKKENPNLLKTIGF